MLYLMNDPVNLDTCCAVRNTWYLIVAAQRCSANFGGCNVSYPIRKCFRGMITIMEIVVIHYNEECGCMQGTYSARLPFPLNHALPRLQQFQVQQLLKNTTAEQV